MNTNRTGFRWFSKSFASLCFGHSIAAALEGLKIFFLCMEDRSVEALE